MDRRSASRVLQWSVVIAALLTALCPLYLAVFLMRLYLQHGQPMSSVVSVGAGYVVASIFYVIAAVLYIRVPRIRLWLQVIAIMAACIAMERASGYGPSVQERNLFRNILAEPIWEMFGRVAIAVLCVAHLVVGSGATRPGAPFIAKR